MKRQRTDTQTAGHYPPGHPNNDMPQYRVDDGVYDIVDDGVDHGVDDVVDDGVDIGDVVVGVGDGFSLNNLLQVNKKRRKTNTQFIFLI